jgi:hypothetical protein
MLNLGRNATPPDKANGATLVLTPMNVALASLKDKLEALRLRHLGKYADALTQARERRAEVSARYATTRTAEKFGQGRPTEDERKASAELEVADAAIAPVREQYRDACARLVPTLFEAIGPELKETAPVLLEACTLIESAAPIITELRQFGRRNGVELPRFLNTAPLDTRELRRFAERLAK